MSELLDEAEPFDNLEVATPKRKKKSVGTEAEIELPEPEENFDPGPSDEDLGELIDGSEDDISDLENGDVDVDAAEDCAPAVSAAVKAVAAAAKRKKSVSMADTKTKAEHIRDEIARRKAKGEENIRPRDIIAALETKGVKVTAPQVSVTLRDFDKPKVEKKAKAAPAAKAEKKAKEPKRVAVKASAHAAPKAKKTEWTAAALSVDELSKIGTFVRGFANPAAAIDAIHAYCEYNAAMKG